MLISGTYITVIYVPANFNKPIHQRKANTCPILIFHNIYSPFQKTRNFCREIKRKLKFVSYKPRLNCDQKYKYRKYIVYIQKNSADLAGKQKKIKVCIRKFGLNASVASLQTIKLYLYHIVF